MRPQRLNAASATPVRLGPACSCWARSLHTSPPLRGSSTASGTWSAQSLHARVPAASAVRADSVDDRARASPRERAGAADVMATAAARSDVARPDRPASRRALCHPEHGGRAGHTYLITNMQQNPRLLAERLEAVDRFELLGIEEEQLPPPPPQDVTVMRAWSKRRSAVSTSRPWPATSTRHARPSPAGRRTGRRGSRSSSDPATDMDH